MYMNIYKYPSSENLVNVGGSFRCILHNVKLHMHNGQLSKIDIFISEMMIFSQVKNKKLMLFSL